MTLYSGLCGVKAPAVGKDLAAWKGGVADGVLVMKDGTKYDIKYSMDYDVFTIKDKFGMYVSRA